MPAFTFPLAQSPIQSCLQKEPGHDASELNFPAQIRVSWRLSQENLWNPVIVNFVAVLCAPIWCCVCLMEKTGLKRPWSGKQLESLLLALSSAIEIVLERQAEELSPKKVQEESKICVAKALKSHLCIGINSVSRALERMPAKPAAGSLLGEPEPKRSKIVNNIVTELESLGQQQHRKSSNNRTPLQAVIVAADVQPKSLVAHLGVLCASRGVVMLPISGGDGSGSLKLGEVLGTRTAIAIGVKEGDTPINWAVESILETGMK